MGKRTRRIGILTGGGDVPGLNAALKSFVWRLLEEPCDCEVIGLRRGWDSLVNIVPETGADNSEWIAPLTRITLKSAVRLPRAAVQAYEVEGRKLFMPMVAVNSHYRWSSGEGQSGASFLVGRTANDSDKLAPLRLDQGKRGWKGLGARRYEKGIRR